MDPPNTSFHHVGSNRSARGDYVVLCIYITHRNHFLAESSECSVRWLSPYWPLRREPPDHKAHCWRVPTLCIRWRHATSTRSGSYHSCMVDKTGLGNEQQLFESCPVSAWNTVDSLHISGPRSWSWSVVDRIRYSIYLDFSYTSIRNHLSGHWMLLRTTSSVSLTEPNERLAYWLN